jgi:SAM-dependent methyltransferase
MSKLGEEYNSFITLLNKTVLYESEERDIRESLVLLTPVAVTDMQQYYDEHVTSTWDSTPTSSLTKVDFLTELKLRYPYYPKFNLPTTGEKLKVLIAGCGSGKEVHSFHTAYKNIEITAVDFSEVNLGNALPLNKKITSYSAYAIRQNRELGVTDIKFHLADISQLTPNHFPQKFDIVVANDVLHYCPDLVTAWSKLTDLVKPGGLFVGSLHNSKMVKSIKMIREIVASSMNPPLFDKSFKLTRKPTDEEVINARALVFNAMEQNTNIPQEILDVITSLSCYSLNEFR